MAPLSSSRFIISACAVVVASFLSVTPVEASSSNYRTDWDLDWLQQTNGGFVRDAFYDPTLFYYTLPSRAKSFALHSYFRRNYYKTYHAFPAPVDYEQEPTPTDLVECGNYTFSRYDRVPPFGYQCQ